MTYSVLTIRREPDSRQVVRNPRSTDVVGHSLRGAFKEPTGIPHDMTQLLQQLVAI